MANPESAKDEASLEADEEAKEELPPRMPSGQMYAAHREVSPAMRLKASLNVSP